MASRVRTRISFGAFANLKNNKQQQIGLNTLITSIKKIVSTFNNNFSYIVNSFNALMQFKYKIDYLVNLNKEETNKESKTENQELEDILEKLKVIKTRLENLENIFYNGSYKTLVNARIEFYIKEYEMTPLYGSHSFDKENLIQYNSTRFDYKGPIQIVNKNSNNLIYEIGLHTMNDFYSYLHGYREGWRLRYCLMSGIKYTLGNYKFYSKNIKVIKDSITDIELGTLPMYQCLYPGRTNTGITTFGSFIVCMRLYGDENFKDCKELIDGEIIVL